MRLSEIETLMEENAKIYERGEDICEEMTRVKDVLDNIDDMVDSIEDDFNRKTGITNVRDIKYLFVAIMLQSLRWILTPEMQSCDFGKNSLQIDKESRLKSKEMNHADGVYKGKASGTEYEKKQLNDYRNKIGDAGEERRLFEKGEYNYRSWIEILTQPVPYDAMNAIDAELIPDIGGLNKLLKGKYSNINGKNHHVATLGHDPILGYFFGTLNIMSSTISLINYKSYGVKRGHWIKSAHSFDEIKQLGFSDQRIDYSDSRSMYSIIKYCYESFQEDPKRLIASLVRQRIHIESDKYCKQGLPVPFLALKDPNEAQRLIEEGYNSVEYSKILGKDFITIGCSTAVSILINVILEAFYLFGSDNSENIGIKKARIKKILFVSNVISLSSNVIFVAVTKNMKKMDVAGAIVTLTNLFKTRKFVDEIKNEYINLEIEKAIMGLDDWVDIVLEENMKKEEKLRNEGMHRIADPMGEKMEQLSDVQKKYNERIRKQNDSFVQYAVEHTEDHKMEILDIEKLITFSEIKEKYDFSIIFDTITYYYNNAIENKNNRLISFYQGINCMNNLPNIKKVSDKEIRIKEADDKLEVSKLIWEIVCIMNICADNFYDNKTLMIIKQELFISDKEKDMISLFLLEHFEDFSIEKWIDNIRGKYKSDLEKEREKVIEEKEKLQKKIDEISEKQENLQRQKEEIDRDIHKQSKKAKIKKVIIDNADIAYLIVQMSYE